MQSHHVPGRTRSHLRASGVGYLKRAIYYIKKVTDNPNDGMYAVVWVFSCHYDSIGVGEYQKNRIKKLKKLRNGSRHNTSRPLVYPQPS
jgi:hypothetical protein